MNPSRKPYTYDSGTQQADNSIDSCSKHTVSSGEVAVITWKLDKEYTVDIILVIGFYEVAQHISQFQLYVGTDADYSNNTPCPGGPFAHPRTSAFGTLNSYGAGFGTPWNNGVEA